MYTYFNLIMGILTQLAVKMKVFVNEKVYWHLILIKISKEDKYIDKLA